MDESNAIAATIPRAWQDTRTIPWMDDQGETIGTTFMASTDLEAFLDWHAEGVAISVSRRLNRGYLQLLVEEYQTYLDLCSDPFFTFWDFENAIHRGRYAALNRCAHVEHSWLSILSVVSIEDPQAYVARVLAYDLPPLFGGEFRDIMMQFQVIPDKLP